MTVLSLFSARYAGTENLLDALCRKKGFRIFRDRDLLERGSRMHHILPQDLEKALCEKASVFNAFTREKERAVCCLRATLAEILEEEGQIFTGHAALLIPSALSHVLRVLITASPAIRTARARSTGLPEKEAAEEIRKADEAAEIWAQDVLGLSPWNPERYHLHLSMDAPQACAASILEAMEEPDLKICETGRQALENFRLESRVAQHLAAMGHLIPIHAASGDIRIHIDQKTVQPSALRDELYRIASACPGVRDVQIQTTASLSGLYRRYDPETDFRVLLVDDETEFVQTLAERLRMRSIAAHAVCSGEAALSLLSHDPPDLMVLDLRMPGMDGFEILTRVKKQHPRIGVIILSGHGTEKDQSRCMALGASAYLQKPADITLLTALMKQAYTRIRENRNASADTRSATLTSKEKP